MTRHAHIACLSAGIVAVAVSTASAANDTRPPVVRATVPLSAATMIIEYNSSAEDIGIQFFLDLSEGWKTIEIIDPTGREIFSADAEGSLVQQGGGTELFLESVEPPLVDLPLDEFFARFPEGTYKFRGFDTDGNRVVGRSSFTHDVPAGPVLVTPVPLPGDECAENVARPVVIAWNPVTTDIFGDPIEIVRYELIVENDDMNYDIKVPATTGTLLTVTPEALLPHTEYLFEVLAVEESGNQTITEGCFTTGN